MDMSDRFKHLLATLAKNVSGGNRILKYMKHSKIVMIDSLMLTLAAYH